MSSTMNEFREFVSKYPKLKDEVKNGSRTWQNIYEEWVLYGDNENFKKYEGTIEVKEDKKPTNITINMDTIKGIAQYVKKINPDDLNRTLNTVQKVIQIVQTVGGGKKGGLTGGVNNIYND